MFACVVVTQAAAILYRHQAILNVDLFITPTISPVSLDQSGVITNTADVCAPRSIKDAVDRRSFVLIVSIQENTA